jgi:hemerythrin-like domain-containing protein
MKAIQELEMEHQGVELMLQIMHAVAGKMEGGEPGPEDPWEGILEFLTVFVDRCHHGKEEEFLFPALEAAGVRRDGGPIGVMLSEHLQGRSLVGELRRAVQRHASGEKAAAAAIRKRVDDYTALLTQHIAKENTVLFPMADTRLDAGQDAALVEAFERLERERIGAGKHEEFHAMLDRLQETYLS